MAMTLIDANILLSILLDEEGSDRVYSESVLQAGGTYALSGVLSEVTHKKASITRARRKCEGLTFGKAAEREYNKELAFEVMQFLLSNSIKVSDRSWTAIHIMADQGLDFMDCYLYVCSFEGNKVATRDGGLCRLLEDRLLKV